MTEGIAMGCFRSIASSCAPRRRVSADCGSGRPNNRLHPTVGRVTTEWIGANRRRPPRMSRRR